MDATCKGTPRRRGQLGPVASAFLMALMLAAGFALRIPTLAWADEPKDISGYEVKFAGGDYEYNGAEIEPEVYGLSLDGDDVYLYDEDTASHFDITYTDNINAGEATITVAAKEGDGEYTGAAMAEFTIEPRDINWTDITYDSQVLYEGTPAYPKLSIVYEEMTLVEGSTVFFRQNLLRTGHGCAEKHKKHHPQSNSFCQISTFFPFFLRVPCSPLQCRAAVIFSNIFFQTRASAMVSAATKIKYSRLGCTFPCSASIGMR